MTSTPLEALVVYTMVIACALYCLWMFMPAPLKRRAVRALVKLSPRLAASRRLQKTALDTGGCGSGCDNCGSAKPPREHKVQLFRRR